MRIAARGTVGLTGLLVLLGMTSIAVAVPPLEERPIMAQIAPQECLFYMTWAGSAEPDAASGNATERLLAEPAIRQLFGDLEKAIAQAAGGDPDAPPNPMVQLGQKFVRLLLTQPFAVYVREVQLEGPPQGSGAIVLSLGEQAAEIRQQLEQLQAQFLGQAVEEIEIEGKKFYSIQLGIVPPITWGMAGGTLLLTVGENEMQQMIAGARSPAPAWLTNIREKMPILRRSTVTYLNIEKAIALVDALPPGIVEPAMLDATGARSLTSYASVTGLDETGYATRTMIEFAGEPQGLFGALEGRGLTADDLALIPAEAPFAAALRIDPLNAFERFAEVVGKADPQALPRALEEYREETGIDYRNDVLPALGEVCRIYAAPYDGGLISGWTAVLDIKDRAAMEKMLAQHAAALPFESGRKGGIQVTETNGVQVYRLYPPDDVFVEPTWCVTDKHFVFGLFPQAVQSFLANATPPKSLADDPSIAAELAGSDKVLFTSRIDTKAAFRLLYPMFQVGVMGAVNELNRHSENKIYPTIMPSGSAIVRHLQPTYTTVRRTPSGVEFVSQQTIPGVSGGSVGPVTVALLLPAVQAARAAAQQVESMNNLKQIALAFHNYHDVHRGMPPSYSTDEEGKPLHSWRVHILPYLEYSNLYDQFRMDEPWDSEHNLAIAKKVSPAVYNSPGFSLPEGHTVYLANTSKNGAFQPQNAGRLGIFSMTDGTSNTIAIVEASPDRAVLWTKPDDFAFDPEAGVKDLLGPRKGGFLAAFMDGSVRMVSGDNARNLYRMFTRNDGEPLEEEGAEPPRDFPREGAAPPDDFPPPLEDQPADKPSPR